MKNNYQVNQDFAEMRLDRWFKKCIHQVPQSFIEKNIRKGKIKVNNKKVKSSYKLKFNDNILIRAMIGSGKYNFRSIASLDSSDFFYDKETKHFEIQYNKYFDYDYFQINNITYSFLSDKSFHYKNQILNPLNI